MEQGERAGTSVAESQAAETETQEPELSLRLPAEHPQPASKAKKTGLFRASCI